LILPQVCFSSPAHFPPYLYIVPAHLMKFRNLLKELGVSDTFGDSSYVGVLSRLHHDAKGEPLTAEQLALAMRLLEHIADSVPDGQTFTDSKTAGKTAGKRDRSLRGRGEAEVLYVPNAAGVMSPSSELVYDDAQWMATGVGRDDLRLAHADLPHDVAERLGLNSLR
jgi:hypothetical protein